MYAKGIKNVFRIIGCTVNNLGTKLNVDLVSRCSPTVYTLLKSNYKGSYYNFRSEDNICVFRFVTSDLEGLKSQIEDWLYPVAQKELELDEASLAISEYYGDKTF
jgi:hypothetical protein